MRTLLLLTLVAALLSGCGAGPTKPDADQAAAADAARAEMSAGNYQSAGDSFKKLADDTRGQLADRYRLNAAEAYFKANDTTQVKLLLERFEFKAEEEPLLFSRERMLEAQLALVDDDLTLAKERLKNVSPPDDQPQLRAEYHLLHAKIYSRQEQPVAAMAERLAADHALADQPQQRRQYAEDLWNELRQLEREALIRLGDGASKSAAGWIDLALIERAQLTDANNLRRTLDDWQLQYPHHPAAETVLPGLRNLASNIGQQPRQIALLLPFDSEYAEAARIIRDGFIAGWYQDNNDEQPILKIYDADNDSIVEVYNQALNDGAEFIVGPLRKETLAKLVEQGNISVPTLALNYYEGDATAIESINSGRIPSLYQFSLAPEDEARQVAERAWFDGHAHALVMAPADEWGDRVFEAFTEQFKQLGGKVLERVSYSPREQQFSGAVESLLNIDESEQRYRALRDKLQRRIESTTRRRHDADFIMLATYPPAGRQIGPQLQFHRASDLPVYSTSHIFAGVTDANADADMNGFMFADMPWLLDNAQQQTPLYQNIEQYWSKGMDTNPRLYAFGIDAYRSLSQLSRMAMDPGLHFEGVSGRLSVTDSGRIQRQLQWARFVNGIPQSLGPRALDNDGMVQH